MDERPAPKLILEEGALVEQAQEISLDAADVIIGRDPEADLVIASPLVSRRHARVYRQDGNYLIEDLGSTNKTYLNDEPLDAPRPLAAGDTIRVGNAISLTFTVPPTEDQTQIESLGATALAAVLSSTDRTMLAAEGLPAEVVEPPLLVVSVAGGALRTSHLRQDRIRLGRAPDNDVVIPSPIVSAHHAVLVKTPDGYQFTLEPGATNPVYYKGRAIEDGQLLHDGDLLRLGSLDPGAIVTLSYHWPAEAMLKGLTRQIEFGEQNQLQIGRDPENDVVLDAPTVSRFHATIERIGQRFRVHDLNSANGTFVNDRPVEGDVWLQPGDTVRVGPYRFVLGDQRLAQFDETGGLRVEALGLNKWVRKDLNLLQAISLIIHPREFVVVVGQSGGGKSTLVDSIAGYRPATHGQVLVNGIDIYRHFDAIRSEIGFVPQRDIIHQELTVYQALDYAARLRMPADTTPDERQRRVMEVLDDLDLAHRKDVQISGLSGGQQKRVSIGVELLTRPGLFFLDEPTSGLDPGTETALMRLMRRLADQGRTIILVTHATKNVMLADRVVFLARGGYLAWFGPPEEALRYFDHYRSERDRRTHQIEFDEIYAILDDPDLGTAEEWAERYLESAVYDQYIAQPLAALGRPVLSTGSAERSVPAPAAAPAPPRRQAVKTRGKQVSALRQLLILSSRNVKILTRDRTSLFLMLASAPLLASLDVVLAFVLGRDLFSYTDGNMGDALITLFQPGIVAIFVGALAMMREFVKETEVYKRERMVNLKVLPYVLSKLWVAGLLALYQAAAYTGLHYLAFDMPGGVVEFGLMYVTLLLAVLAGMALGLLASALAPNANAAPLLVVMLLIPQVALSGALIPVPSSVSSAMPARWTFEGLVTISGGASDLAADPCWALPAEERDALSLEEKEARGCLCLGLSALDPSSCSFPGLGALYDPALDEPEPVAPAAVGNPPAEPVMPPAPQRPADSSDSKVTAQFLQELDAYNVQVAQIQAGYQAEMAEYQSRSGAYGEAVQDYQELLAEWNIKRSAAVSRAEGLLGRFHEDYGWAFVDKNDPDVFWPHLLFTWGVQAVIITLLFGVILFAVSRKAH
ncbi:MAG TPA: FHA domain-containing protein [Anaerolineae bacterium]|nr:FHA domain-containing protein [Anaerolineae bacterium]